MKKIYGVIIMLLFTITLAGCFDLNNSDDKDPNKDPELLNDKVAPLLQFEDSSFRKVTVKQNTSNFNIYEGLKAMDNKEGNITHKIEYMTQSFDITTPGEYEVLFFVSDIAGNISEFVAKVITVEKVYQVLEKYPIHTGAIPNEVAKPENPRVFAGAYYYKVVSAKDKWLGIEAELTLPMPDLNRYSGSFNDSLNIDPHSKSLDNPSVYMGGYASYESDIGLSLKNALVKNESGVSQVSAGSFAFRPFWRYITNDNYDEGTYDRANGRYYAVTANGSGRVKNMAANWDFNDTEFYYLPGDRIRMLVYSPKPGFLQMQIEVIEKSSLEYSVKVRKDNGWEDPANFISPVFSSPGHGGSSAEFKRVNAIDQVSNEGKPTQETTSVVHETIYHNVYLHRMINGTMHRVPMNASRVGITGAPVIGDFEVTAIDPLTGGQTVKIYPRSARNVAAIIPTSNIYIKKEEV